MRRLLILLLAVLTGLAFAPLAFLTAAIVTANLLGCTETANEALVQSCYLGGVDIKGLLNVGFVMGWIAIATFPLMLLSLLLWIVVLVTRGRTRTAARPQQR